jgi:hypothetical protein
MAAGKGRNNRQKGLRYTPRGYPSGYSLGNLGFLSYSLSFIYLKDYLKDSFKRTYVKNL